MKSAYEAAKAALGGNGLTTGLEKLSTDELIAKYPDGVTVTGFDIIKWGDTDFPLVTFAEDPTKCFGGGIVLKQMIDGILEEFDGDIDEAIESLRTYPFKIRLYKTKSKAGRKYTGVTVLQP